MNTHLHLPHISDLHWQQLLVDAFQQARHHGLHKPKPVYTDPAVIAAWAEYSDGLYSDGLHDHTRRDGV